MTDIDVVAYSVDPIHIKYLCPFGCQRPEWVRKKVFHQHGSCRECHNRVENRVCDNCPNFTGNINIHITDETIRERFCIKWHKTSVLRFD